MQLDINRLKVYNKSKKFPIFIFIVLFIGCVGEKIDEITITSSSSESVRFFNKAMRYFQIGENVERAYLDSALSIDLNFALALNFMMT